MLRRDKFTMLLAIMILAILVKLLLLVNRINTTIIDEYYHYNQIRMFILGDYRLMDGLATLPGYHVVMASIAWLLQDNSIPFVRTISFLFNTLSIAVFFFLARLLDRKSALVKTLQYTFLPILFPFFFLIYTDVFSTLFILISLYLVFLKKYKLAGTASIISMLVRQNNIVWSVFLHGLLYFQDYGGKFDRLSFKQHLKKSWVFLVGYFLFLLFVIINRGFAVSGRIAQPISLFNFGNVYFLLFLFFFLFLPVNIVHLPKVPSLFKDWRVLCLLFLGTVFFFLTFANSHPLNQATFFLRNRLLVFFTKSDSYRALFFFPVVTALFCLSKIKLRQKRFYLLYPTTLLYLLPSFLIEQRYYLIPFSLFILFRKTSKTAVEYVTVCLFIILSFVLFDGIVNWKFFL